MTSDYYGVSKISLWVYGTIRKSSLVLNIQPPRCGAQRKYCRTVDYSTTVPAINIFKMTSPLLMSSESDSEGHHYDIRSRDFSGIEDEDEDDLLLPPVGTNREFTKTKKQGSSSSWHRGKSKYSQTDHHGEEGCLDSGMLSVCFGVSSSTDLRILIPVCMYLYRYFRANSPFVFCIHLHRNYTIMGRTLII